MHVLGLCGSLRRRSYNRMLLAEGLRCLPAGVSAETYRGLGAIPGYDEDAAAPASVLLLREAIAAADAVLIATPEYNGSVPGGLKNALDWASRPFPANVLRGKPVAVIGASTGLFGAVWAQAELRNILGLIGARVLDEELPIGQAHESFDAATGRLLDPAQVGALHQLVGALVELVERRLPRSA